MLEHLIQRAAQLAAHAARRARSRAAHDGSRGAPPPAWLFLRECLRDPAAMGAVCASSGALADCIAHQLDLDQPGWIVELGAGTGAVTAALLRRGVAPERLIVVERSRRMVRQLRQRFPHLRVIEGDAGDAQLAARSGAPLAAVVSGLPLRSLPASQVARVTATWASALGPGARLIQFTYARGGASPWMAAGLRRHGVASVWRNLPPARVEVFQAA